MSNQYCIINKVPPPPPLPPVLPENNPVHMWAGREYPAHLDNIKEWQLKCGDELENILLAAFKQIYAATYDVDISGVNDDDLWPAVKDVLPGVIRAARRNHICIWNPTADNWMF